LDIGQVLKDAVDAANPTAQAKNRCPDGHSARLGQLSPRHRLQQVIWNLLSNA